MTWEELSARLPAWGRLFDAEAYDAFQSAVRDELAARGLPFELHGDYARLRLGDGPAWDLPLLELAQRCAALPREEWQPAVKALLDQRIAEERLGRELDEVRGDYARARPRLKLRIQPAHALGKGAISAELAAGLHAVLVLDLPSFVTPVRPADLAAWERPAEELLRAALENVKSQEKVELKKLEVAGAPLFAVSGAGLFVATLALAAEELVGADAGFGTLLALPSSHILLCHSLRDRRSLQVLEAMAAGALQAFEGGPAPLSPDLLWKRGDRFVALPVRREEGKVKIDVPADFDEHVTAKLPEPGPTS